MHWREFKQKAYNGLYKAWFYPRIYLPNCEPIIVFTGGKTGTTTLRNTLYRQPLKQPVFWAHVLRPEDFAQLDEKLARSGHKRSYNAFWQLQVYRHFIVPQRPVKIITSTRELVAKTISGFFQRFRRRHGQPASDYIDRMDELNDLFFQGLDIGLNSGHWFDTKFEPALEINVFDYPFVHEQGYQRIQHHNIDVLILRIETSDKIKQQALGEFLGIENVQLYRANVGAEKGYAEVYRRFCDQLVLPETIVDTLYNQPVMQHFYTQAERDAFRARYNISDTPV